VRQVQREIDRCARKMQRQTPRHVDGK
jgi:hypothetical protein